MSNTIKQAIKLLIEERDKLNTAIEVLEKLCPVAAGKMNQVWAGVKPYYQLYQGENYYFFTYFGPKLNLNTKQVLIETGLINYTQVSKHFYTSCAFGVQMYNGSAYPGFNFGLNLVY